MVSSEVRYPRWMDSLELRPRLLGCVDRESDVELERATSAEIALDHLSLELDPCFVEKGTEAQSDDGGDVSNLCSLAVVDTDGVTVSRAGLEWQQRGNRSTHRS